MDNSVICYYCKRILRKNNITIEHKIPISRGGKNNKENKVLTCKKCNNEKSCMNENEYKNYLLESKIFPKDKKIIYNKYIIKANIEVIRYKLGQVNNKSNLNNYKVKLDEFYNCLDNIYSNKSYEISLLNNYDLIKDEIKNVYNIDISFNKIIQLRKSLNINNNFNIKNIHYSSIKIPYIFTTNPPKFNKVLKNIDLLFNCDDVNIILWNDIIIEGFSKYMACRLLNIQFMIVKQFEDLNVLS